MKYILAYSIIFPFTIPPHQQFAHLIASIEALREKQRASGKEIEGLFEGLMQRSFCGQLGTQEA